MAKHTDMAWCAAADTAWRIGSVQDECGECAGGDRASKHDNMVRQY